MRRLFWTFVPGVPGVALLVMRIASAAALVSMGIGSLSTPLASAIAAPAIVQTCAGLLLLLGLWTPIAGLIVVLLEGWRAMSQPSDAWTHILLATLGGALALLGPGAWSIDARLFGWKRIDIKDRAPRADIDT